MTVVSGGLGVLFLRTERYVVGRGSGCDWVLDAAGVSRCHAVVEVSGRVVTVTDQRSRNGTKVDGRTVEGATLRHGSLVRFGTVTCLFEWLASSVIDDVPTPSLELHTPELSPAEQRVLTLLLDGLAEKAIAGQLGVSRHTVHNHVKRIYSAYRVNTRAELLAHFVPHPRPARPAPEQ